MQADRVEISRDGEGQRWLVRIQIGGEVIRRHVNAAKDADESTLRIAAVKTAEDEGYTVDPADVAVV